MKNPKIAEILKEYRKLNHLSVKEVADYLHRNNVDIAVKSIYGWENGQTQPSAGNLMLLCRLYQIRDVLATFGYDSSIKEQPSLSRQDYSLVTAYHSHPEMHEAVNKLLDINTQDPAKK